ncbi:ComF family protein [Nocardia nova]|uniref:ComF family protein n=1 Tax=Nocardia nova TaxID=37330 RepID=UPI0011AFE47D|nr:hypothetical protein [Nocardia nova]
MTDDALMLRGLVRDRVGGFFHNAYPSTTPSICPVCRGPSEQSLCRRCWSAHAEFGELLADRTIVLTYALGGRSGAHHQSAHHLLAYKGYRGTPRVQRCAQDLRLMVSVVMDMHRNCLQGWLGGQWDSLTFVPSVERPDRGHPVAELANAALPTFTRGPRLSKFLLTPGARPGRELTADRFRVDERWRDRIEGRNVLIVDDSWVTGASAQSAVIAVKRAGAATATVLCVARWLRGDWADHKRLIGTLQDGFDVLRCPVTGHSCSHAAGFIATPDAT